MAPAAGLSRATFAKLSPHPYLLANLEPSSDDVPPARSNGRAPHEVRPPTVNSSSLSHAHGSAVVRMGDTTVICGVRGETILTSNIPSYRASNTETELSEYDLLVPNIELATGCAPQFLPGGPPTTLAQTLSTRIYSLLHSSKVINPDDLRIWQTGLAEDGAADEDRMEEDDPETVELEGSKAVAAYWVLYIDIFFISFDGNPFDAAWAATMAALRDTKLPRAWYDADREMVISSRNESNPLTITNIPIACTAVVFTGKETDRPATDGKFWLLVDPDLLEESLCDESVTIVVDCKDGDARILSISKHGGTALTPGLLTSKQFLSWASKRWEEFNLAIVQP
ncbi:hypothetical protein QQZ08_000670 [Neonectria magnoliae]|uniref:Ribosomal RNA-processing protein 43 n=1 Tax=Neonectria magnoliae TaxID=2732573 RepID=A0ABR1IGN6_9HYPO